MSADSALGWLVETSLAVSALIVLILIIRRPVARMLGPEAAYLLWLAPVGRLLTPELAILPAPETAAFAAQLIAYTPYGAAALPAAGEPAAFSGIGFAAAAVFAWAAGACVFLIWQLAAQKRFLQYAEANSEDAPAPLMAEANVVAERRGLKRAFRLRVMHDETGPLVAGFLKPVILVPHSFVSDYEPAERQMALAHEFAHIARGDLYAAFAALIFRATQWPNPLVHIAYRFFRSDQEAACDAAVLNRHENMPGAPHVYAAAIVKSARGEKAALPACGLSIAHHLKERLMLMKTTRIRPVAGRLIAGALIVASLGVSASYGYAADKKKGKTDNEAKVEKSVDVMRVVIVGDDEDEVKVRRMIGVFDDDDFDFDFDYDFDFDAKIVSPDSPGVRVFRTDKDVDARVVTFGRGVRSGAFVGDCIAGEGEPAPVMLKFSDEKSEGDENHKVFSILCLSGDDAGDPEKTAKMLRKAIDKMEANAAKEAERRARIIASLREQLKKLEAERKATKKEKK